MARRIQDAQATPKGQKKDFSSEMLKGYDPKYVEAAMCVLLCAPCAMHACPATQVSAPLLLRRHHQLINNSPCKEMSWRP